MHRVSVTATVLRILAALGVLLTAAPAALAQGRRTVLVQEYGTGRPLANAEVVNLSNSEAVLADAQGTATIPDRWVLPISIRIRQIGFHFADTTVAGADASVATQVSLRRVAYALPAVAVTLGANCALSPPPDAALLAATALEQLRMAAERYNTFKTLHPFTARLERRTKLFTPRGQLFSDQIAREMAPSAEWGERYDPRRIVESSTTGFSVQILFLAHLADPAFWRRHCFEAEGIANLPSGPAVKLRFAPLESVVDPEWEGSAFLDSATSALLRLEFRLARLSDESRPYKLQGYTTFTSPIPTVVLPESTVAVWWRRKPDSTATSPDVLQFIRLTRVQYRGKAP
jgi:hypothetical protein